MDESAVREGVEMLERAGFRVSSSPRIYGRKGYLAGSDEERAGDFNAALSRDDVGAIMIARGGYGLIRIIDRLELGLLKDKPKIIVGFSDASALLCYVSTRLGVPTIHGCMLATSQMRNRSFCHFDTLLKLLIGNMGIPYTVGRGLEALAGGREVEGVTAGGCLSVLVSLLGTPYEPDMKGKLLVLEETGEKAYRVDRMITQLRISGLLERTEGVVMGRFIPVEGESVDHLEEIVADACSRAGVPVFRGLPVGHEGENVPFPLGVRARVVSGEDGFAMEVVESHFEVEW